MLAFMVDPLSYANACWYIAYRKKPMKRLLAFFCICLIAEPVCWWIFQQDSLSLRPLWLFIVLMIQLYLALFLINAALWFVRVIKSHKANCGCPASLHAEPNGLLYQSEDTSISLHKGMPIIKLLCCYLVMLEQPMTDTTPFLIIPKKALQQSNSVQQAFVSLFR